MESDHSVPAQNPGALLNRSQQRRFEVLLEMLEGSLNEVERVSSFPAPGSSGSLIAYEMDISADFRDRSAPIIQRLRAEASALARELEIVPSSRSRVNTIRAILTAEIVRVDDAFSNKLGGYGPVSPRVELEIDPKLSEIRSDLKALLAEIGSNS